MLPPSLIALLDRARRASVPLALCALLSGCASLEYYAQLGRGHLDLLRARQPVAELLADPAQDPALQHRLQQAQQARRFASSELALPDNGSYRVYAQLQRPYVVWNVFATEEFSLAPQTHCFPIAGCVAYRGYYQLGRARGAAALMQQQGLDTYVGGVEAYSTLGWFDDPLLSTMLRWDDQRLAALIFHELAHQHLYVQDDTAFNESFASFVEEQGLRQWRASQNLVATDAGGDRQRRQFTTLILASRERLQQLYDGPLDAAHKRAAKAAEFERLRAEYCQLRDSQWQGDRRYDAWINAPLNNAKLLPFGLYDQWVPAFAALFRDADGDWPAFYARAEQLAHLPPDARLQVLQRLNAR